LGLAPFLLGQKAKGTGPLALFDTEPRDLSPWLSVGIMKQIV
jgi:hypothetical protein